MVTAKQLVSELDRRGYPVSDRQIRDWRDKGLLPPLTRHGKGRGKGVLFCWKNEDVIGQSIAVYELLGGRERTSDAFLGLWFIGYPKELKKIKRLWLSRMKRTQKMLYRGASGREGIEDALSRLSTKCAKHLAKRSASDYMHLEPLVTHFFGALLNSDYSASDDELWGLDCVASKILGIFNINKGSDTPFAVTDDSLKLALDFTRRNLSLDSAFRLIESANETELELAHQRWRAVIRLIALFSAPLSTEELAQTGRQVTVAFAGFCILALLHLERFQKGRLVDFWIKRIERQVRLGRLVAPSQ